MAWRSVAIGVALALPAAPLVGQAPDRDAPAGQGKAETGENHISAGQALEQSRKVYGPPAPSRDCGQQRDAEIVVCAEEEDQSQYRVQSTAQLDPESDAALDDGIPRAPDFRRPPCVPNLLTICVKVGGAAPPPAPVDLSKLPEAPEGSDADLIAKGKKRAD